VLRQLLEEAGIGSNVITEGVLPHGVTAHSRTDGRYTYLFVENYNGTQAATIPLPKPMENMLTGETQETAELAPYGFQIYRSL
jgi:hypothetical protein